MGVQIRCATMMVPTAAMIAAFEGIEGSKVILT
jgi:hypothetical protein